MVLVQSKTIATFIVVLIGAVIALAFLSSISDNIKEQTSYLRQTNETIYVNSSRLAENNINASFNYSVTKYPGSTGVSTLPLTTFTIGNSSSLATVTTNYVINYTDGTFYLVNSTFWVGDPNNLTRVSYSYGTSQYVADSTSRNIISLILIFGAIAILIFIIAMIFKDQLIGALIRRF